MYLEEIRDYCLSRNASTEDMPFDDETLVFKVCGKMFALLSLDGDGRLNLKCTPIKAIELREQYDFIIPGYHMNKKHWNTIVLDAVTDSNLVFELIDHSYEQVLQKLPQKLRKTLKDELLKKNT